MIHRRTVRADEFCVSVRDGTHDSPKPKDSGLFLVTSRHITGGRIDLTKAYLISREDFDEINKRSKVDKWDVLISMIGTVGETCLIKDEPNFAIKNVGLFKTGSETKGKWLYYYLRSALAQQSIKERARGTTQQYIPLEELRKFPVLVTDKPEEMAAIVSILSTLDDKIELNMKMNQTLEVIAQAIFKSWFVDFDPVKAKARGSQPQDMDSETAALFPDSFQDSELDEIPKEWEVSDIGKSAEVIDCLHSKKPDRQLTGKPLLQLWNIRDDGLIDMTDTYFITPEDYSLWISRIEASPGDCVITNVGRVGAVGQIPEGLKAALGRNMTSIRCKTSFPYPTFLIEWLLSDAMKIEISLKVDTGTILDALNVRNIPNLRFVLPSQSLLERFEEVARPLRSRMEKNLSESHTLAEIRDTLLPKLISGQIRIKDAEKFLENVG